METTFDEACDSVGLARDGLVVDFTGIDDPYEEPENAEVVIDTQALSPEPAAHRVLVKLEGLGYLR